METNIKSKAAWWRPGIILWVKMSAWIAFPAITGSLIGNYLDSRFGKGNLFLIISITLAFIVSIFSIRKLILKYMNESGIGIKKDNTDKKNDGNK